MWRDLWLSAWSAQTSKVAQIPVGASSLSATVVVPAFDASW
jgi:hypothetical protein